MKVLVTADGSKTAYSEEYKETFHSVSGAVEEAMKKFVEPCRICELAKRGHVRILDIGFGLGYNIAAALDAALQANPCCHIHIISLEKDLKVLAFVRSWKEPYVFFKNYAAVQAAAERLLYLEKNVFIKILLGDAVKTIYKVRGTVDVVFLDPFSPRKNPELWSDAFLRAVSKRMSSCARLATFSCSKQIRKRLATCGLQVYDGPCIGRKAPSTIAVKP